MKIYNILFRSENVNIDSSATFSTRLVWFLHFQKIYLQLDQQVQNFTLALLDQCQSSDEVKAILSGKQKLRDPYTESSCDHDPEKSSNEDRGEGDILPLVYTAVRMEQKKVRHSEKRHFEG